MTSQTRLAPIQTFTPPSGRTFSYCTYGAADGDPVLAFHGTPGSRLKYAIADQVARQLNLRLLSIDRWGYGATPPPPRAEWSVRGFGEDMQHLLDDRGLGKTSVVGISGGGPYALGTAAVLKGRVSKLALVAPVAPLVGDNANQAANGEMTVFHRVAFFGVPRVPGLVRGTFGALRQVLNINGPAAMRLITARASSADRRIACEPSNAQRLAETFRVGLSQTTQGAVIDMNVFSNAWDVDLKTIDTKTRLWIGSEDRNVPLKPATALAQRVANLEVIELRGAGHFWISQHYADVLNWLAGDNAQPSSEPKSVNA